MSKTTAFDSVYKVKESEGAGLAKHEQEVGVQQKQNWVDSPNANVDTNVEGSQNLVYPYRRGGNTPSHATLTSTTKSKKGKKGDFTRRRCNYNLYESLICLPLC